MYETSKLQIPPHVYIYWLRVYKVWKISQLLIKSFDSALPCKYLWKLAECWVYSIQFKTIWAARSYLFISVILACRISSLNLLGKLGATKVQACRQCDVKYRIHFFDVNWVDNQLSDCTIAIYIIINTLWINPACQDILMME